jgi:multidrug efflux pump
MLEFEAGFDADAGAARRAREGRHGQGGSAGGHRRAHRQEVNVALFPVLVVHLHGNVPERALIALARDLRDTLEGLPGVLDAEIAGDRDELLEVIVDPVKARELQPRATRTCSTPSRATTGSSRPARSTPAAGASRSRCRASSRTSSTC